MSHKLRIEDGLYPNNTSYKRVMLDDGLLGTYTQQPNGWLPYGKRKPLSELEAILAVIDSRRCKVLKELELLDAARSEVFERQAEWKQQLPKSENYTP